MDSIRDIDGIAADFVLLAVVWDEVNGPTIISKSPQDGLADPINIALQIYLSSVAVFGQHSQTTRIDFSLPLLSISSNHIVRVAFDSWPDPDVRGDERPFFLGLIMDRDKDKILGDFIQENLWDWMDSLKEKKNDFQTQEIYNKINDYFQSKRSIDQEIIKEERARDEPSYTEEEAIKDLEDASDLWTQKKDRSVLNQVLKSAYRLDGNKAGSAYFLAGNIFFSSGDYENAIESYNRAAESFKKDPEVLNESIGESMFNAAICAYRLENFELAQSNLVLSSTFLNDSIRKARLFLYLAQTQFRLEEFENASSSFELAVDNALESDDSELAGQILSVYASRLQERANSTDDPIKFTLLELSAKQRDKASEYFSYKNLNAEAGTSLVLSSKTYQMVKNYDSAITKLEQAAELFLKDNDYYSAGRTLFDVIELYKHVPKIEKQDLISLSDRAKNVISKIKDESIKVSLLTKLVKEKAKILETLSDYNQALENYDELYNESKTQQLSTDQLTVFLAYANLLFKIENFKKAGEVFFKIYKELELKNDDRAERVRKNANVSFRRATSSFNYTATVLLHEENSNTDTISQYYIDALHLLKLVIETSSESEKEITSKFVTQTLNSITVKIEILPEAHRDEIMALLSSFQN